MGVIKSPRTPFTACVRRVFWRYQYLRAFSGVDTGAPGIKSDWHSCHLQLLSHLKATPVVVGLLTTVPPGTISSARPQQVRKLRARLKKYARLSAGTFSRLTVLSICVPGVSQIMSLCFYHNGGMLLWASFSSFWYLDIVLSSVITLYFICHNDGWLLHTRI